MKKTNMSAIAVDKCLVKEYETSHGRTAYLEANSEFQIKLFNPTTDVIAAEVFVNGKSLGNKIVINPGQIIWLERYLDDAKKFRFEVYEVDASIKAVRDAIENNGDIKVRFYKEKPRKENVLGIYDFDTTIWADHSNISTWPGYSPISSPFVYTSRSADVKTNIDISTSSINTLSTSDLGTSYAASSYSNDNTLRSATLDWCEPTKTSQPLRRKLRNTSQETGRVSKGSYSSQRFTNVDLDLEPWAFKIEEIKLLPKSQKPFSKNDLEKIYCHECGRKLKPKFKFCPFCGAEL